MFNVKISKRLLFALFIPLFLFSCVKDDDVDVNVNESHCDFLGTVVDYTGLDGCGLVIELDNGTVLEPLGLNSGNQVFKDGDRIWCSYTLIDTLASFCMAGQIARIDCIESVNCSEIVTDFNVDNYSDDPLISLENYTIVDDCLYLTVTHSGGCEIHGLDLVHIGPWCGTPPVPPTQLKLYHDNKGDMCEALISRTLTYDLSKFQNGNAGSTDFVLYYKTAEGIKQISFSYSY
jgi:hypothetical protein